MSNVKTDYVDYALKPVGSGNPVSLRKFETYNATTGALESTIYVKDVTDYATVGSNILASDLNTLGNAVNSNSANFASEYSPSLPYAVGAYCTYQNILYKCTTEITTPEAWNSAHWTAVKSMNETACKSGSNANGNWIRYPDGTQICYTVKTASVSINHAWGALYESEKITLNDYPVPFVSIPTVTATLVNGAAMVEVVYNSLSGFGTTYICKPMADSAPFDYRLSLVAIGRWF